MLYLILAADSLQFILKCLRAGGLKPFESEFKMATESLLLLYMIAGMDPTEFSTRGKNTTIDPKSLGAKSFAAVQQVLKM